MRRDQERLFPQWLSAVIGITAAATAVAACASMGIGGAQVLAGKPVDVWNIFRGLFMICEAFGLGVLLIVAFAIMVG